MMKTWHWLLYPTQDGDTAFILASGNGHLEVVIRLVNDKIQKYFRSSEIDGREIYQNVDAFNRHGRVWRVWWSH